MLFVQQDPPAPLVAVFQPNEMLDSCSWTLAVAHIRRTRGTAGVPTNVIREYTVKRHRGEPGHTKDVILGATNGVSPDPCDMTASGTSKTSRTRTLPGRRDPFQQTLEADPAPSPSARPVSARTPTRINHAT